MSMYMTIDQMVIRLRDIHDRRVIHRDIKPENFIFRCAPTDHLSVVSPSESTVSDTIPRTVGLSKILEVDGEDSPSPRNSKDLTGSRDFDLCWDDCDNFKTKDLYLIDFGLA